LFLHIIVVIGIIAMIAIIVIIIVVIVTVVVIGFGIAIITISSPLACPQLQFLPSLCPISRKSVQQQKR
jgi:hypothetical protein